MGINDACGNPISYKYEAIQYLKGLTDTVPYPTSATIGDTSYVTGDIGLDGYIKNGDSWGELTNWGSDITHLGLPRKLQTVGPQAGYFDYAAPAYFHEFANFLAAIDSTKYAWNIFQFRRAEASSDWLIGKLYQANQKNLPVCGNVTILDTTPTFTSPGGLNGEDFRLGWRTITNQLWHGKPGSSWNPSTHLVDNSRGNTFEMDMAKRYAAYLWDNRQAPWNKTCTQSTGTNPFAYWGPSMLVSDINGIGNGGNFYFLNWLPSVGSPSAIIAQDFNLMSDLYRYLEIEWDVQTPGDGYLTSVPVYYHGWFRLLGLLLLSGNYHSPTDIKPTANTKVYLAIDKTFAFEKDTVQYTIDYRNFGSLDASGVTIVDTLHPDFVYVSSTGGGMYNVAAHTVTWNIGTLPGFKSSMGYPPTPTTGQVKLKVKVGTATQKQYRNKVSISCSNGSGWTSNEYPNHITSVMERNYLDIAKRALVIKETASVKRVKPGSTVQITVNFQNTSDAGWINGGRPGVHFSFSQTAANGGIANMNTMRARLFHDAQEAYIDYGNYRYSYFLYDTLDTGLANGSTPGWAFQPTITEGIIDKSTVKLVHENITPGHDSIGRWWNQRVVVQFSDPTDTNRVPDLATIDHHLSQYRGMRGRIHKGGTDPLRLVWFINSSTWTNVNWSKAWSWDAKGSDDDANMYYPVTNDWTDLDHPDIPVNNWNPKSCYTSVHTVNNILVEEWDGYTWRRVAGNGPMPGRDVNNVVIRDTIPAGFSFVSFSGPSPLGVAPVITGNIITWTRPKMQINEQGTITYTIKADGSCPTTLDLTTKNRAWILADKESPFADSSIITISCDTVVKPPTPDHLDIVLDTTTIDSLTDAPLMRITLDAGTKTAVAYAVVRDASGNLMSHATNLTWTTRDPSVVTVAGSGWQVTATKTGVGATFIVVNSPGLKPDSLAITTEATPPWPAIVSAAMTDTDGNLVPDLLVMMLTDTFHVNQQLDSIVIVYRGNTYSIAASTATLTGTALLVPFAALTGVDPVPTGQVTIVLTVDGNEKRVTKNFTDGIGPQLQSAVLIENNNPAKSMVLVTFTEQVQPQRVLGQTILGIIAGRTDTITFTVDSSIARGSDSVFDLHAVSGAAYLSVGDRIRLVPGSGGMKDLAGNTPHPRNPFVTIGQGTTLAQRAVYFDGNADGYVDTVIIYFGRPVSAPALVASFDWGDSRTDTLGTPFLGYYRGDSSKIAVGINNKLVPRILRTSSPMASTLFFRSFTEETQSLWVADSAAPVLMTAVFYPGAAIAGNSGMAPDTIVVKFSELAQQFGQSTPLQFLKTQSNNLYSLSLSYLSSDNGDSTMRFLVTGTSTVTKGDSVWMSSGAFGDRNNPPVVQWNPKNRRVPLLINWPKPTWNVTLSANPFSPGVTPVPPTLLAQIGANGPGLAVIAQPTAPVDPAQTKGTIAIYDAVGDVVISEPLLVGNGVYYFVWNGDNRDHRAVGTGTYLAMVRMFTNNQQSYVKRVMVGVRR